MDLSGERGTSWMLLSLLAHCVLVMLQEARLPSVTANATSYLPQLRASLDAQL